MHVQYLYCTHKEKLTGLGSCGIFNEYPQTVYSHLNVQPGCTDLRVCSKREISRPGLGKMCTGQQGQLWVHNTCTVKKKWKNTCIQNAPAFHRYSDSALVTSGDHHRTCEHQVASVEILMEFCVALCHISGLGPNSHLFPCATKSLLRHR